MRRAILLFGTFLFCVSLTAWAQDTATIVGAVLDSTGAVIPGAKLTVDNADKGFHRDLVANAAGEYNASKIPLGNYVITAEAPGFQKLVRSGITVAVGQTLRVDLQLTVGQVTQEVTVTGNITRVETETAAISDVVTGSQIANLQLNGRNWVTLATLIPGASPDNGLDTSHVGVYGNNNISFNGGRTQYNNWEIDGGPNTDEGSAGTFNTYPSLDTIGEFRISTSNYGADMGKHAGATIEVATKSGTKDFHGSVFEYVRNNKFDANPWFQNRASIGQENADKTPRKWNDYGYNIGGPFYIPGVYNTDKTKTFFFWSQNWRKYREGQVIGNNVPTLLMRDGDFTECDPDSPNYNEVLGCKMPRSTATGAMCDPDALPGDPMYCVKYNDVHNMPEFTAADYANGQILLNAYIPKPNTGTPAGWLLSSSTATNWRQEQIRVDQNIGEKTRVFVRYTQDAWDTVAVPSLWNWSAYDTVKTPFGGPGKSAVLNIAHTFKPNLINEFVMGYTVDHIMLDSIPGPSSVRGNFLKGTDWTAVNLFAANQSRLYLPDIAVCGGTPVCIYEGQNPYNPWFNSNPIITWKDNVAWTTGRHTLKFGFFLEKFRKNEQYGSMVQGVMSFDDWGGNTTGNGLADMFLGRMQNYNEGTLTVAGQPVGGYAKGHWRMTAFEPYIQDDWKVSRKLTLNLGARYYLFTRIHDVTRPTIDSAFMPDLYNPRQEKLLDSGGNIDNSPASLALGYTHDFTTFGNGLVQCGTGAILKGCQTPYYMTLSPRFGFAYDPWGNGKTVIRGGYGIYYEMGNGNEAQMEGIQGNPPTVLTPNLYDLYSYSDIEPISDVTQAAAYGPPGIQTIPYRQKWGNVQQFSLGMQHEFRGNNVLGVSYVGALGRHLARNRDLNQLPIGIGTVNVPWLADEVTGCDAAGDCDVQDILIHQRIPADHFRPYRGYGSIGVKENTAVSSYNALQVSFRHVFGHGLTLQTSYTWAKTMDDSTSTYASSPNGIDDHNLSRWKSLSDLNRSQILMMNYVYELPFFKNSSGPVKSILGGWTISGITSFFTGQPVNFNCGVAGRSSGIGGSVNCNSAGAVKIKKGEFNDPEYGPTPTWWDTAAAINVTEDQLRADGQPGMFGTMGRNVLTGPGRNNWDLAILKNFQLPWFKGEHATVQFRFETFNTWNHPQFRGISAGCDGKDYLDGSKGFGRACNDVTVTEPDPDTGEPVSVRYNGGNGQVSSAWDPRIIQLGLKFIF